MTKTSRNKRKATNNSLKRQAVKDQKKAAKTGSRYDALDSEVSEEEPEPVAVVQGPAAVAFANPVANVSNYGPPPAISGPSSSNAGLGKGSLRSHTWDWVENHVCTSIATKTPLLRYIE